MFLAEKKVHNYLTIKKQILKYLKNRFLFYVVDKWKLFYYVNFNCYNRKFYLWL